jgi:type III secretory pathway lipoprotein EscJ
MKYLVLTLLFFASGCKPKEVSCKNELQKDTVVFESVETPLLSNSIIIVVDTVFIERKFDSLQDVIKMKNDSLFIERYKLERVRYYNKIAQKNSSQLKFLPGWINRATN